MQNSKNFQEITAIAHVTGKDENGNDLALTRVSYKKFSTDSSGNVLPDDQDTGSEPFVGSFNSRIAVTMLEMNNVPEDNIIVTVSDAVNEAGE